MGRKDTWRKEKEESLEKLDQLHEEMKRTLLRGQSPISGLYPRYVPAHGAHWPHRSGSHGSQTQADKDKVEPVGEVRSSVYAAMATWALGRAYRRLDDDRGRQFQLCQTAVKTMRGVLTAWAYQSEVLEAFKASPKPANALHSRFHLHTLQPVLSTTEYSHLQMDVVALFLLTLAQMTAAGAEILLSTNEFSLVQNLVYYIERAYRTPEFGMWERGTRYNDGTPEIHSSTLGMVKAALEALSNVPVLNSDVYVDIDAHNRNRSTLETLLPRESHSRNTDAALVPSLLFPAFASHQPRFRDHSLAKLHRKLDADYGLKRFLRDGYGSPLEKPAQRHYLPTETTAFQDRESEWPMFHFYFAISDFLAGKKKAGEAHWNQAMCLCLRDSDGWVLVPECYAVGDKGERTALGEDRVFVWGQSLYFIGALLGEDLVAWSDVDPLARHLPAVKRPTPRLSKPSFYGSRAPVVQLALIAETRQVQQTLSTFGVTSQTPHEVQPIQLWPSSRLVKILATLGESRGLGLSGRPQRPIGSLGTSKAYRVLGETVMCVPILFDVEDFYLSADPEVLMDELRRELVFVASRWKLSGRPTLIVLVRESNLGGEARQAFLRLLSEMRGGSVEGVRVKLGRLQSLLVAAATQRLDSITTEPSGLPCALSSADHLVQDPVPASIPARLDTVCLLETDADFPAHTLPALSNHDLQKILLTSLPSQLRSRALTLEELIFREGIEASLEGQSHRTRLEQLSEAACAARQWPVVRLSAALLRKHVASLAPSVTAVLVRGNRISLGVPPQTPFLITNPIGPAEITAALYHLVPRHAVSVAVLSQELLIALETLISVNGDLLREMLTVDLYGLIRAMQMLLRFRGRRRSSGSAREDHSWDAEADKLPLGGPHAIVPPVSATKQNIFALSPTQIKSLLWDVLAQRGWEALSDTERGRINAATRRIPHSAYDDLWAVLGRCPNGIRLSGELMEPSSVLSDMTRFELNFAFRVEALLCRMEDPTQRPLFVQLLSVLHLLLERHPELRLSEVLELESVVAAALPLLSPDAAAAPVFAKVLLDSLPLSNCATQ